MARGERARDLPCAKAGPGDLRSRAGEGAAGPRLRGQDLPRRPNGAGPRGGYRGLRARALEALLQALSRHREGPSVSRAEEPPPRLARHGGDEEGETEGSGPRGALVELAHRCARSGDPVPGLGEGTPGVTGTAESSPRAGA